MAKAGSVLEAEVQSRGSQVVGAHSAGATVLLVADPTPFDDAGGQILVDAVAYSFTGVTEIPDAVDPDSTNAQLTLTSGLVADVLDSMPVDLWNGSQVLDDLVLWVSVGESADPAIPVTLNADQRKDWEARLGPVDPPVAVLLSDDYASLYDAPGYTPTIDLSSAVNFPDPVAVAVFPPALSPDVKVTGLATGLMVTTAAIDASTVLNYLIDGVVVREGTHSTAEFLTSSDLGGDAALVADTDYAVSVVARNAAGSAPASAAVTSRLDLGVPAELVLGIVSAGVVFAGSAQFGNITIDPDTGYTQPLANGGIIKFPTDGSDATITAKVVTNDLTVQNHLTIQGETNKVDGGLSVTNGVTKPVVKPTVGADWSGGQASTPTTLDKSTAPFYCGLVSDGGAWWSVFGVDTGSVVSIDKTTGVANFLPAFGAVPIGFFPKGGLAKVGTSWYVLGYDSNRSYNWYVYVYSASWAKTGEWQFVPAGTSPMNPSICADGSGIRISYWTTSGTQNRLLSTPFTVAGVPSSSLIWNTNNKYELTGSYYGSADFGATRLVLTTPFNVYALDSAGVQQTAQQWTRAPGGEARGLAWDGTQFHTLGSYGAVWHYSPVSSATSRSTTFTWYDNSGTTHETEASPVAVWTQLPRQWMRVDTPPPAFGGGTEDPNAVRIYVANQRQADLATGATTATYGAPATGGANAPTSNSFPAAITPGYITSTGYAPGVTGWRFNGDGSWDLADLTGPWKSYTPTLTATTTNPTFGPDAFRTGRYMKAGKLVVYRWRVQFGTSGNNFGSGTYFVDLPFPVLNGNGHRWTIAMRDSSAGNEYVGSARPSSNVAILHVVGTNGLVSSASAASPFTFDNSDYLEGEFIYETA